MLTSIKKKISITGISLTCLKLNYKNRTNTNMYHIFKTYVQIFKIEINAIYLLFIATSIYFLFSKYDFIEASYSNNSLLYTCKMAKSLLTYYMTSSQ